MAQEIKDWTPFIVGGTLLVVGVGGYLFYQSWQRSEAAEVIRESWGIEAEAVNAYLEQITAGGREPTEEEWNRLSDMIEDMSIKEERIYELSRSEFERLVTMATELMGKWYLIPIAVAAAILGAPIAGWVGRKVLNNWFRFKCIRCKPPRCEKCGRTFTTEEELRNHIANEHPPTTVTADIVEAQSLFAQVPYWVQAGVAAEAELWDRVYQPWPELAPAQVYALAFAIMVIIAIGAISVFAAPTLGPAAALLLI